jgi:uncharacterized protein (TIGR02453 family)
MALRAPCFTPKCLSFFRQLTKNNTREWFTPRKQLFEAEVRAPMLELSAWINDRLRSFAVEHVVEPPARAVYRIYRDTRFSKDKTPYKTHVGAIFPRRGLPKHGGAGYYVGVSHDGVEVAGGMYMPGPEELAAVRAALAADGRKLAALLEDRTLKKLAGAIQGDQLVRLPKGFEAEPGSLLESLLRRKQWYLAVTLPAELATTPKLGTEVMKRFEAMAPVVNWLNRVALAARRDEEADDAPKRPVPMF